MEGPGFCDSSPSVSGTSGGSESPKDPERFHRDNETLDDFRHKSTGSHAYGAAVKGKLVVTITSRDGKRPNCDE